MNKKQDDSVAHELRDRPVPPVKGSITDREDVRPRPEQNVNLSDSIIFNGLM